MSSFIIQMNIPLPAVMLDKSVHSAKGADTDGLVWWCLMTYTMIGLFSWSR